MLKKILNGHAPDFLSEKLLSLKYHKSHDRRSRLPYRLPIPRPGGGGGVLAEKLGRGVRSASQSPYPISDQNLRFSLPYL